MVVFSIAIAPQISNSCAAAPGYPPCVTFWQCHLIRPMMDMTLTDRLGKTERVTTS